MQFLSRHFALTSLAAILALGVGSVQGASILIDFGPVSSASSFPTVSDVNGFWNNWMHTTNGAGAFTPAPLTNLIDSTNTLTGIGISSSSVSYGALSGIGTSSSTIFPSTATTDGWVINLGTTIFTMTGLDPNTFYNFTFYGSRLTNDGTTRISLYNIIGEDFGLATLDAVNNVDGVGLATGVRPMADGTLTIQWSIDPVSTILFGYLNAMRIDYVAVPEPSSLALASVGVGLLAWGWRRRFHRGA